VRIESDVNGKVADLVLPEDALARIVGAVALEAQRYGDSLPVGEDCRNIDALARLLSP